MCAVVLAAGKGKRMGLRDKNKVTLEVAGKPLVLKTLKIISQAGIKNVVVVVGFAKDSVIKLLGSAVKIAEQKKRLGTGHAVKTALEKIPDRAREILVLYGDDSFLYTPEILRQVYLVHQKSGNQLTFVTTEVENPSGLGRILRDKQGQLLGIVEEKDASPTQKQVREINSSCYLFSKDFLARFIGKIPKSPTTGEYYLTSLIELALKANLKVEAFNLKELRWRGVNTPKELAEAQTLLN